MFSAEIWQSPFNCVDTLLTAPTHHFDQKSLRVSFTGNVDSTRPIVWYCFASPRSISYSGNGPIKMYVAYRFVAILFFPAGKLGTFHFSKKRWRPYFDAEVTVLLKDGKKKISALPLPKHSNPCRSHEQPNLFQIIHRKTVTGQKVG